MLRVECKYCHVHLSCRRNLNRHQKTCPEKERLETSQQQQDAEFRHDSHDGINLVTHSENRNLKSMVWKDFIPLYVEGGRRIQDAECIHCHKRLSVGKNRSNLNQHNQTCPGRGRTSENLQKRVYSQSSVLSSKSRLQDELSPALTNGVVQIAKYASKFLKSSSGDRISVGQHVLASASLEKMDPKEQNIPSSQTAPVISRKFDQEASYQELTRMVILHGYPISIVEHEEMISFAKSLNPAFNMASKIDIEEYSTILFEKEKDELQKKIALASHRVSLSACLWTSHASDASVKYLCLAVHFIDSDWKLQRKIIKFRPLLTNLDRMIHFSEVSVLDSESGPFNIIWEAIRDWNLDQKLFSLTSVGEIRNDKGTSKLKDFLIQRKCLPIGGELYNIACMEDVLNSIVSKGQPILHLIADILERFIQAHMSTALTQELLTEVVTHMGLKCPQENAKWWHKIYFGLEVVLHFKKAFSSHDFLSAEDTNTVESVCKILRTFYHAIEVISGPICSTANKYFNELWIIRTTLEKEASTNHTELASLVWEMQEAFDEYWQNSYVWLSVPVVLDPRFKLTLIEFRLKQAFGTDAAKYVSVVRDTIWDLFLEYCSALDKPSVETSNCVVQTGGFYRDSMEDWDKHLNEQTKTQALTELKSYLEDGLVPRKDDFDILNWWMSNSTKYPTLSIVARDVLAIPASAMYGEAALSSEGSAIHKQWSTLNIKTIEALVCTRDWIK
ncbi:unnamed protein product [Urochloa decumbens]|uniref:Uncharacterized protein n=1 Tax=Urochloa decumbens TaxID=240449 RepID=A0ABC9BUV4_9POAL